MKPITLNFLFALCFMSTCNAQPKFEDGRASMKFPKESALLNINDSILIGKYFMAVKGYFYVESIPLDSIEAQVYIDGYRESNTVKLSDLQKGLRLITTDTSNKVYNGEIGLLKTKNASLSKSFNLNVGTFTAIPKIEILEVGDIIAFTGMKSYDGVKHYSFPARWYRIIK